MGKHAPKAPNPAKTAESQYKWNKQGATDTLQMNAMGQSGPFGTSTFEKDAAGNPIGINTAFSGALQPGANAIMQNVASQAGLLPSQQIKWDNTTPQAIFDSAAKAYTSFNQPLRDQENKALEVRMAERGIPIGGEVWKNEWDNIDTSRGIADNNAAAQAWQAMPGIQGQLTNNAIAQYSQPYQAAASGLGLLGGLKGLTPQASQPQANVGTPNYAGLVQDKYNADMANYQNKMGGLGQLVSTGLGLLTAPMTGGTSLLGMGLNKMGWGGSGASIGGGY